MRRLFDILLISIFCCLVITARAQQTRHVILISIDGLHPDMYLDKDWPTPNLKELMKTGTYADHMKSVFPSYIPLMFSKYVTRQQET